MDTKEIDSLIRQLALISEKSGKYDTMLGAHQAELSKLLQEKSDLIQNYERKITDLQSKVLQLVEENSRLEIELRMASPERYLQGDVESLYLPVDKLRVSSRIKSSLKAEGINLVGELVQLDKIDILKIPNLGKKALAELVDVLSDHGLMFGLKVVNFPNPELIKKG